MPRDPTETHIALHGNVIVNQFVNTVTLSNIVFPTLTLPIFDRAEPS